MEARCTRAVALAALLLVSLGAKHRTANYIVETADPRLAVQFAEAAERYRHDLAVAWLGEALPNWSQPCPITVQVGPHLGAGGATTFVFDRGEVFGWRMNIQGSAERVLDSVLPHEITHMIFASHFRQPLPRWADEGGATSVEHFSERNKHRQMLFQFLRSGRGIAFNKMFAMKDYPSDIMPLYAQGYSVAEYLIQIGGRRKFVDFVGDGLKAGDWSGMVQKHYGIHDLGVLQETWLAWVRDGSPLLPPRSEQPAAAKPEMLAASQHGSVYATAALHRERNVAAAAPARQNPRPPAATPRPLVPVQWPASNAPAALPGTSVAGNEPAGYEPAAKSRPSVYQAGWRAPAASAAACDPASGTCPLNGTTAVSVSTEVARPQPYQQPQQMVLEWSQR